MTWERVCVDVPVLSRINVPYVYTILTFLTQCHNPPLPRTIANSPTRTYEVWTPI